MSHTNRKCFPNLPLKGISHSSLFQTDFKEKKIKIETRVFEN